MDLQNWLPFFIPSTHPKHTPCHSLTSPKSPANPRIDRVSAVRHRDAQRRLRERRQPCKALGGLNAQPCLPKPPWWIPMGKWEWYIYLTWTSWFLWFSWLGKYTSPMDPMGKRLKKKMPPLKSSSCERFVQNKKRCWWSWCWKWSYIVCGPLTVTVTTRIITFLVGDPYKPSFTTATVRGPHPNYIWLLCYRCCLPSLKLTWHRPLSLGVVGSFTLFQGANC